MGDNARSPAASLPPPSEFLSACPKFRILVLGSPESTKQELFTKVFGVYLGKKQVDDAFRPDHDIEEELDLQGQNERLAIHTSLNFGTGDERAYQRVSAFLSSSSQNDRRRVHCIWYCVASEEERGVSALERRFFSSSSSSSSSSFSTMPVVVVFTKYDELVGRVRLEWAREADRRGWSKTPVSGGVVRGLAAERFEERIGRRWDGVLRGREQQAVPRVRVSSGGGGGGDDEEEEDDARTVAELARTTLACLREPDVRLAFVAAQRNSAMMCTRVCADLAAEYFDVDTGHARKRPGTDVREIVPDFFGKAVQVFNLRGSSSSIIGGGGGGEVLGRVIDAAFDSSQKPILAESLRRGGTESGTILLGLSPHERAVLLAQALAGTLLFLHRVARRQWRRRDGSGATETEPQTLTPGAVARELEALRTGRAKKVVMEVVEASTIFTTCMGRTAVADLMVDAVKKAEEAGESDADRLRGTTRTFVLEDDTDFHEMSLGYAASDKASDGMTLPCGLTILPLT